jgi:hypothetical protein
MKAGHHARRDLAKGMGNELRQSRCEWRSEMTKTDDQSLAAAIDESIKLLPPNMTPAERTKAASDFAFDYALKATFGTTFEETRLKSLQKGNR